LRISRCFCAMSSCSTHRRGGGFRMEGCGVYGQRHAGTGPACGVCVCALYVVCLCVCALCVSVCSLSWRAPGHLALCSGSLTFCSLLPSLWDMRGEGTCRGVGVCCDALLKRGVLEAVGRPSAHPPTSFSRNLRYTSDSLKNIPASAAAQRIRCSGLGP
jgi:hypothetical protein